MSNIHLTYKRVRERVRERTRGRGGERVNINYRKNYEGAWVLSAFVGESGREWALTKSYYFYTKREATRLFKEYAKNTK